MLLHAIGVTSLRPYRILNAEIAASVKSESDTVVIDAGCGVGDLAGRFLPYLTSGSRVIGMDWLELPLAFARKLQKDSRVRFVCRDLSVAPWNAGEQADVVTMINVLYALKDPKVALRELANTVKPGGRLILVNPWKPDPKPIFAEHDAWLASEATERERTEEQAIAWARAEIVEANQLIAEDAKQGSGGVHFFKPTELTQMLAEHGFQVNVVDETCYAGTCVRLDAVKV